MMPHKISLLVRADVGRGSIELLMTGCLTTFTVGILAAQISRARELGPSEPVLVDLTDAQHIEPEALEELWLAARNLERDGEVPLRFALPTAGPVCPTSDSLGPQRVSG